MGDESTKRARTRGDRVLVVGSINVDLYQRMADGKVRFHSASVDVTSIKGQTLPAKSFAQNPAIKAQLAELPCEAGKEEAFLLSMDGPFDQKTGGKGANTAAAAGQTWPCEFVGNLGSASADANAALLADLAMYGAVETGRCQTVAGCATGTAYILSFSDGDNAIVLIGGANQEWPAGDSVPSGPVGQAMRRAVAVMLQREIPARVNAGVAALASRAGVPVILDVGGTDEALDSALLPFVTLIAPNESELTFISGVQAVETNSGAESISGVPAVEADSGAESISGMPAVEDHSGAVFISGVRAGVAALKARFGAAGNPQVEVLVTLGRLGSLHFGADWALVDDPISSSSPNAHLHPSPGDASGGAQDDSAASRGMLPHETRMGIFSIKGNQPVDTTGAGDCYRGSFVAARYGDGKSVAEAMRWAAAASSLAVETTGAMPSMPTRAAIAERAAGTVHFRPFA